MNTAILALLLALPQPILSENPCLGNEPTKCEEKLMDALIDMKAEVELCKIDLDLEKAKYNVVVMKAAEIEKDDGIPLWLVVAAIVASGAVGVGVGFAVGNGSP